MRKPIVVVIEIILTCLLIIAIAWFGTISFEWMAKISISLASLSIAFVCGYVAKGGEQ